jgi:hypothetical protein
MKQWFHNFYLATRADMVTFITLAACVLFTMSLFFNPFIGVFDKITITVVCLLVLHLQGMGLEIQSHEYAGFHLLEINRSYAIILGWLTIAVTTKDMYDGIMDALRFRKENIAHCCAAFGSIAVDECGFVGIIMHNRERMVAEYDNETVVPGFQGVQMFNDKGSYLTHALNKKGERKTKRLHVKAGSRWMSNRPQIIGSVRVGQMPFVTPFAEPWPLIRKALVDSQR